MEAIHIELSDETVHFVMPEVAWKHLLLELPRILNDEFHAVVGPVDNFGKLVLLKDFKGLKNETCNFLLLLILGYLVIHWVLFKNIRCKYGSEHIYLLNPS